MADGFPWATPRASQKGEATRFEEGWLVSSGTELGAREENDEEGTSKDLLLRCLREVAHSGQQITNEQATLQPITTSTCTTSPTLNNLETQRTSLYNFRALFLGAELLIHLLAC